MFSLNSQALKFGILLLVTFVFQPAKSASAADAEFVGKLALISEDEVANSLLLSDNVKEKLRALIDQREEAAIGLVLAIKDLNLADQKAKLAPFVAESERLGLRLLTNVQKNKLEQIRLKRKGLLAIAEPSVAEKLNLTDEQRTQAKRLLDEFQTNLNPGQPEQERLARITCLQELSKLLLEEQRNIWEQLINIPGAATAAATTELVAQVEEADPPQSDPEPADDNEKNNDEEVLPRVDQKRENPLPSAGDGKLQFSFRYAPWQDVLDWFATQAGLSLHSDTTPPGTFNYTDSRRYTPSEAIDVINSILLTKGFTLIRREKALILINLEDGIPPNLVQRIAEHELDNRGEFELVSCLFAIDILTPEEAETEILKLLGPQGAMIVLPKAKQILVTETAGRLRTIRSVIHTIEKPDSTSDQNLTVYELEHATADEALTMVRQLLGLPEDSNAAVDGSLRVAVDAVGNRLIATGKVEQVKRVAEIIKLSDVPLEDGATDLANLEPQLEVYKIPLADPTTVLQVLQTILAGDEETRLTIDEATGNLVALARPSQQATIRATIAQMERDARQVEVIRLRVVDPQLAVLSINRLFGVGEEEGAKNAPRVEAELTTRQLLIRGTQGQISQIRILLEKMGETNSKDDADGISDRQHTRPIPHTAEELRDLLPQLERAWLRRNRILIDPPLPTDSSQERGVDEKLKLPSRAPLRQSTDGPIEEKRLNEFQRLDLMKKTPLSPNSKGDHSTSRGAQPLIQLVSDNVKNHLKEPAQAQQNPLRDNRPAPESDPPLILVLPGPEGSVIASKDLDALDEFETLLSTLAAKAAAQPSFTVFYLKYAKARTAAELLKEILGGETGGEDASGGGLLGDLAGAAMGDLGGDLLGGLLGMGGTTGTFTSIGSMTFVPDSRLNAIFVQGETTDIDMVERLLRIIDQEASPEDVQTVARPQIIPIFNSSAVEIAEVVRQVYSEQLGSNSSRQRQPSPEQIIRALRGGRGGQDNQGSQEEKQKMTMSVDERNNLLIIAAEESLFQEVKTLVEQLDFVRPESQQIMRVITLKQMDPATVQQALSSIAGDSIQINNKKQTTSQSSNRTESESRGSDRDARRTREIQRRIEFFNQLQRAGQRRGNERSPGQSQGRPKSGGNQGNQPARPAPRDK